MDCGSCDSASPISLQQPEVMTVELTITERAQTVLTEAFGDDHDTAL